MANNYETFCSQLDQSIAKFPNLSIKEANGKKILKGILDVGDETGLVVGSFFIEIHYKEKFPYKFPKLYEIGGLIPNEADWHKYPDGACCITVEANEILECKNGISVELFISKYAKPFFANHIYRQLTGSYKNGEYSHGVKGIFEFYKKLLGTDNFEHWHSYFNHVFKNQIITTDRNSRCFCGSGVKFKRCHSIAFDKLKIIGEETVRNDFNKIIR